VTKASMAMLASVANPAFRPSPTATRETNVPATDICRRTFRPIRLIGWESAICYGKAYDNPPR
jgi:hypothetical protein